MVQRVRRLDGTRPRAYDANGETAVYRYRSQIAQRLLEERNQALERLEIEAEAAFLAYLELISGQYADFRAGQPAALAIFVS